MHDCVKMADEVAVDKHKEMCIVKDIPNNKDTMMTSGQAIARETRELGIAMLLLWMKFQKKR